MNDLEILRPPASLSAILEATRRSGFTMASDAQTGSLLRTLAATKPGGALLELGTGTGLSAAWLLDGMTGDASLLTVDNSVASVEIARTHLAQDPRISFHVGDGGEFLEAPRNQQFDFIFADTWPGKYTHLDQALALLKPGGIYVVDDMLPQPNWPADHAPKVAALISTLEAHPDLHVTKLNWSTGIILGTKSG